MPATAWEALAPACWRADLSMAAFHLRYLALGGLASSSEFATYLTSGAAMSPAEHDVAVHALNERFLELDDPERVPYSGLPAPE